MLAVAAYVTTAGIALVVFVRLLFAVRANERARRAALACAVTAGWAGVHAAAMLRGNSPGWAAVALEGLRYGALFLFLSALAPGRFPRWLIRGGIALCAGLFALAVFGPLASRWLDLSLESIFRSSGLVLAFVGLVLTEQAIRAAPEDAAKALRLCAAVVGGMFAYDLFLFSQAYLLGALDAGAWALRGGIVGVLLIPLGLAVPRLPAVPARVFISRHVVFYSSAFIAVGSYLCLMALGGYYVREQGGYWGNALQVLFLLGAAAILVSLLVAESPLRRLRVFIATHFYRNKYDYRIAWLRFVQTLSSADEPDIRATAIRAVAEIFGSPGGFLVLRDKATGNFHLQASWPSAHTAPPEYAALHGDDALPRFLRQRQWVVDVREYAEHPARYGDMRLPAWLPPQGPWRVIAPLLIGNHLFGFLVLRAPPEPFTMNFEDRDLLKTVGRNVAVQLAQREADESLAQSRQFDAYNRFAAFVMHDLKNCVAQLQLLLANAERHRSNPVFFDDAMDTIRNSTERMTRLIEQLQSREVHGTARVVDLTAIAQSAVMRSQARQPAVLFEGAGPRLAVRADPDRLGAVIDHVIRNAQDATPEPGKVAVSLTAGEGMAHLHVIDEGMGMDEEFVRNRLFKPFDTTKGAKGMGIGAYQTREYIRSLGGDVEVQSAPGSGTNFSIRLVLCETSNQNC